MLVDLHAHSKGISSCCKIGADKVVDTAKEYGFGGLAIANHYVSSYFTGETYHDWIEKYIAEWRLFEALGQEKGLQIFKAIEVTLEQDPRLHMLIYGADEAFLRNYPLLCDKTLPELYELCEGNGCALVQGHPFRGGATVQDTNFLHGVEINCHPNYKNSFADQLLQRAKSARLSVTVGCDYHADTYRPRGGMLLPDTVKTDRDLVQYILHAKTFHLQIHEPADGELYQTVYER